MYRVYSTARTGSSKQTAAAFWRDYLHSVMQDFLKWLIFFQIPVTYHQPTNSDIEFIKVPCFASFSQFCTEQISENIVGSQQVWLLMKNLLSMTLMRKKLTPWMMNNLKLFFKSSFYWIPDEEELSIILASDFMCILYIL